VNLITAHVSTPKPGEVVNGDALLVREDLSGRVLLAVIDGLGHGRKAADASQAAILRLNQVGLDQPLLDILKLVHQDLRGTRGAAATVCLLGEGRLEACAVGNVQLSSSGVSLPLVLSAGVLGHQVGTFRICRVDVPPRYRLMLYSDGISTRVRWSELANLPPAAACEAVYAQYRRAEDDATILVADVNG
jgi:negative regulator of sigma-B (phosphoserine phosphatase)